MTEDESESYDDSYDPYDIDGFEYDDDDADDEEFFDDDDDYCDCDECKKLREGQQ